MRALTSVPIIAVAATAPQATKASISSSLGLSEPVLDRPNIFLSACKSKGLNVSLYVCIIHCRAGLIIFSYISERFCRFGVLAESCQGTKPCSDFCVY